MSEYRRDILSFVVSILLSILLGYIIIPTLKKLKAGQSVLGYVENHAGKAGTTTMGGFIFALSTLIVFIFFTNSSANLCLVALLVSLCFLIVGFLDDYIKIKTKQNQGLTAKQKILFQTAISLLTAVFALLKGHTYFFIPFVNKYIDFGFWGAFLVFFVFLATTNCVNLTDGLDGLAGGVGYLYLLLTYLLLKIEGLVFTENIVNQVEINGLARLCIIQAGAIIGFLFFNTYSAKVFMGDTGSLYLGGMIATVSIFSGNTFFIPLFGIMFVISGISVIIQVCVYKLKKKRVFLMAPLHHHYEYKGHSESKIVFVYKLVTLIVGAICIISVTGN